MYFDPLGVERVLHQSASDANRQAHSGKIDLNGEPWYAVLASGSSYREFAHDFEDQVSAFRTDVSGVQQILKLRICIAPTVLGVLVLL